jgi:hypothetical protein
MLNDFPRNDGSSNRSFGLVFAAFFFLIGFVPLLFGRGIRIWSLGLAMAFALAALLAPRVLAPLNRLWTRFGALLHSIVSPAVLGIMFFVVITPTGLIMRLLGKDLLRLRQDYEAPTYWIARTPPGPPPKSFVDLF